MNNKLIERALIVNRVMLGIVMLVPGLLKLFLMGPEAVIDMVSKIGFPIPILFGWILIISEIIFGLAIIANYKLKYMVIVPIIILLVASFSVHIENVASILLHLVAISNYVLIALMDKR